MAFSTSSTSEMSSEKVMTSVQGSSKREESKTRNRTTHDRRNSYSYKLDLSLL